MNTKTFIVLALTSLLVYPIAITVAADKEEKQDQASQQKQEQIQNQEKKQIYGWELMSAKERTEHRNKMSSLKTEKERTAYRMEHHKTMQQRAEEKGATLPDKPLQRESGFGAGAGTGAGRGGGGGGRGK